MPFLKSLVWQDQGLNPGLPDHWRTLYPLNQWDSLMECNPTILLAINFSPHIYIYMCVCVCVCVCVIGKLNRPSIGYYKFISAGHSSRETNLYRSKNGKNKIFLWKIIRIFFQWIIRIFFQWILTRLKNNNKEWGEDMGVKLMSEPDVMSSSSVIYP